MINLLPPETRENIMYARRNTLLLRWSMATVVGILGIVVVIAFGYLYLNQITKNIEHQAEIARQDLEDQDLEGTKKRAEEISNSFKLVTQVLSKQVLFSELIPQVGAAMPRGASLSSLSLSNELEGGIDLEVVAIDYQSATQVQVNLQDPNNKIFEKVDIVSVSCSDAPEQQDANYPCTGTFRALFGPDNAFTLLGGTP